MIISLNTATYLPRTMSSIKYLLYFTFAFLVTIMNIMIVVFLSRNYSYLASTSTESSHDKTFELIKSKKITAAPVLSSEVFEISKKENDIFEIPHWISPKDPIRKWGCHLNSTPLIFVHIGKSGGGTIRRKLAGAALDFTRPYSWWKHSEEDKHFYPLVTKTKSNATIIKHAKFCNQKWSNQRVSYYDNRIGSVNGKVDYCLASSPLGKMIACPETAYDRCQACEIESDECNIVYTGHTLLGEEISWLPPKILQKWWQDHWQQYYASYVNRSKSSLSSSYIIDALLSLNEGNKTYCPSLNQSRPRHDSKNIDDVDDFRIIDALRTKSRLRYNKESKSIDGVDNFRIIDALRTQCLEPLGTEVDEVHHHFWTDLDTNGGHSLVNNGKLNYASIYSSLPVHRVTMIREPFSWLMSKFFWHELNRDNIKCDDISFASEVGDKSNMGWAKTYITTFLTYLCGTDCISRFERNLMTLEDMEAQAESNLRQSFSVVGILEENDDDFYDMMSKRFGFLNFSLNESIEKAGHPNHNSMNKKNEVEWLRCKSVFNTSDFQREFLDKLPSLAILNRLYKVAAEVNQFQKEELSMCVKTP